MDYPRPPIVESVIELRFSDNLNEDEIRTLSGRLSSDFPAMEDISDVTVKMTKRDQKITTRAENAFKGHKRTSADTLRVSLIYTDLIAYSQLAPYPGWVHFKEGFCNLYSKFREAIGYKKIWRVGVRYINRIDVPVSQNSTIVPIENFLKFHPELPVSLETAFDGFAIQGKFSDKENLVNVIVNVASTPAPLPNFVAFLLDIDLGLVEQVPQRDSDLLDALESMRAKKNEIFEACITDQTRGLFL